MRALTDAKVCELLKELGTASKKFSSSIDEGIKLWKGSISPTKFEERLKERRKTTRDLSDKMKKFGEKIDEVTDLTLSEREGENALKTLRKRLMIITPILIIAIASIIAGAIEYNAEKELGGYLFMFFYFFVPTSYVLITKPYRRYSKAVKVIDKLRGS
ncbi:MAG: hypothetical protein AVW06_03115 [Hadesarchaea archaeon DG-33-1]|nr:MAG: hypothetical protein AVW06_03115 [Hadesarchaea archaeon DG-33-1]